MACSAAVALSGCGAREAEVVKGAFEQPIESANVVARAVGEVEPRAR